VYFSDFSTGEGFIGREGTDIECALEDVLWIPDSTASVKGGRTGHKEIGNNRRTCIIG